MSVFIRQMFPMQVGYLKVDNFLDNAFFLPKLKIFRFGLIRLYYRNSSLNDRHYSLKNFSLLRRAFPTPWVSEIHCDEPRLSPKKNPPLRHLQVKFLKTPLSGQSINIQSVYTFLKSFIKLIIIPNRTPYSTKSCFQRITALS